MLPSGWADRARYAGDSSGLLDFSNSELLMAGVGGKLLPSAFPFSVGAREEEWDSERLIRVTGGGLHRSYKGSPEAPRSCRVRVGAMIAFVTMAEWASNISTGLLSFSVSGGPVDQIYALRSSLPHMTYFASSLNEACIWLQEFSFPLSLISRPLSRRLYTLTRESLLVTNTLTSPLGSSGGKLMA